jgi:hypothetical protein
MVLSCLDLSQSPTPRSQLERVTSSLEMSLTIAQVESCDDSFLIVTPDIGIGTVILIKVNCLPISTPEDRVLAAKVNQPPVIID